MPTTRLAILGLGRMGEALARRLMDAGHDVVVWDRDHAKAARLQGATPARQIADAIAARDIVLTSVSDDGALREVTGSEFQRAIGDAVFADCSTISPALSEELSDRFERFVALPILGAPPAVRTGEAAYLAGGPGAALDRLEPVLRDLTDHVIRYDRASLATTAKLASNLLLLAGLASLAEAIVVGRSGGMSDAQLAELLGASPMLAPGLRNRLDAVVVGEGPVLWTTPLGAKDARLAVELAERAGLALRVGPVLQKLYEEAASTGLADEDVVSVVKLYEPHRGGEAAA